MSRISQFNKTKQARQQNLDDNRVVLYVRASTPEQVNSLDAQKDSAARFAEAKGLRIDATFIDAGVSAVQYGIRERPQAKAMFKHVARQQIGTILVLRLDRAFRTSLDFSQTLTWAIEQGFAFRFIDPDVDYGSPMGKMFAGMEALRAEMECELRAERVNDGLDSMRRQRLSRNGNQAGYGWAAALSPDGLKNRRGKPQYIHLPVPAEQAVLRHIKALWDQGKGGHGMLTAIAATLNQLAIPTKLPAGTEMRRTVGRKTGHPREIVIITDGTWKPMTVKSVLAHAVLATDAELPDGIPSFEQAAALLSRSVGVSPTLSPAPALPPALPPAPAAPAKKIFIPQF